VQPDSYVRQIPVGVQQKVEILKALIRKAHILILDEPTAVLTPQEVDEFFESVKKLTKQGYSVILITHKIEEVMRHCDRVTVMREGRVIDTVEVKDTSLNELARMMVGREVFLERTMTEKEPGEVLLEVEKLNVLDNRGLKAVNDVSFQIRAGEILGFAGVDGNGQLELGEAVVGLRKLESGKITIGGEEKHNPTPRDMLDSGIAHISDDRHKKGLVLPFSVEENLILGSHRYARHRRGLLMDYNRIAREAQELVETYDVRPPDIDLPAGSLSGGNQQKVILARELSRDPQVLVALQPTRGLDVGAIEFVRSQIVRQRDEGKAILLVSTDIDEILTLSDRIAVIYKGEILEILPHDTPVERIGMLMGGIRPRERAEHA
jgi:simple sugar transport system ATP-binding protein